MDDSYTGECSRCGEGYTKFRNSCTCSPTAAFDARTAKLEIALQKKKKAAREASRAHHEKCVVCKKPMLTDRHTCPDDWTKKKTLDGNCESCENGWRLPVSVNFVDLIAARNGWTPLAQGESMTYHQSGRVYVITRVDGTKDEK